MNASSHPQDKASLYAPDHEHDACGVGFVARLDGVPSHRIVEQALEALGNMSHRGGRGGGKENADGAGLLLPLPRRLMDRVWQPLCKRLPRHYAVGHFFLPPDAGLCSQVESLIESTLREHGFNALVWRDTPVRPEVLPGQARADMPRIRQLLVAPDLRGDAYFPAFQIPGRDAASFDSPEVFERRLYVARRHMEQAVKDTLLCAPHDFYAVSLSSQSIVYKGMLPGAQLAAFYPDLAATDCLAHFAVFHERYSTNTRPAWRLVQPFHGLAHNGEINTLSCNQAAMRMREPLLASPLFKDSARHIVPVLDPHGSDSAMLDNALELLRHSGRSLAHSAMMLAPEPFGPDFIMGQDKRAFYEYHAALMEPWDGPSALIFTDGHRQIGAMLDRNALRPCRYLLTTDNLFVLASESGVLDIAPERVARRGRLQPRRMLMVDFAKQRIVTDAECKARVISQQPYRHWVREKGLALRDLPLPSRKAGERKTLTPQELSVQKRLFGFSEKEISDVLTPMGTHGQEPVVSMGLDTPLAVLSHLPQLLFAYMKQRFAQVTNPPIDPLREGLVMTLTGFAGKRGNLLEETPEQYSLLRLANPVLFPDDLGRLLASPHPHLQTARLSMLFPVPSRADEQKESDANSRTSGQAPERLSARTCPQTPGQTPGQTLEQALDALCAAADEAIAPLDDSGRGASLLLLSDADADEHQAPIPSLLAVSALHHHLLRTGRRHACSLLVDTGEAREVIHLAQLIAFGASAVHPRLAFGLLEALARDGRLGSHDTPAGAHAAYATALQKGLLKTFSRMGISTLRSFMGGMGFEAVGIGKSVIDRYFTDLPSRLGGIGLEEIAADALTRHHAAHRPEAEETALDVHASSRHHPASPPLRSRKQEEKHLWSPGAVRALHKAVRNNDREQYRIYADASDRQLDRPVTLRGLLHFQPTSPVPLNEVEPESALMRRFVSAAMSLGSISPEAHAAIAVAFNRAGGRSNCGEGGEAPERLRPLADGDSARSKIRQIASGRFGVTASYLINADEIQIKIAQGAKPGEGGQLPAHKVLPEIAKVRHTIPGVTLISPPPHHDIYSIEDLSQLVYDLKRLHPEVRVSVKLVAGTNVGTVATGVAKAGADGILISGHDGGTGASPRTAVTSVGLPWELGLAETQAALVHSGLRGRIRLQVDGQLRTGRDLAVAALLGADEFGLGASLLVSLGCCMLRICHLGTCPVGIAAQDPHLRARFAGKPEHVENFLRFLAADLRGHMAALGMRGLDDMIGRADLLGPVPLSSIPLPEMPLAEHNAHMPLFRRSTLAGLDLTPLCVRTRPQEEHKQTKPEEGTSSPPESPLDRAMLRAVMPGVHSARPAHFEHPVRNTDRAVCARLSGEIARLHGEAGLSPGTVRITLTGTAGQSAGAFLTRGILLTIQGDANDYAGKGLSGGILAVRPVRSENAKESDRLCILPPSVMDERAILGNVALYGATSGEFYAAGSAGERFAVRNSGAFAVVEGVGDHGCEYMTAGVVVVLGSTGYNFAAGMSGGTAFVLDQSETFQTRCNMDGVNIESVWEPGDISLLHSLLTRHVRHTDSALARSVLADWKALLPLFLKVTPIEYRQALARMRREENPLAERIAATEEVYNP